ncbi:MAG TPA: LysM peptidoglycan-binding domain-containing protein [Bacillota bacterium]|nr:LysM peptidoglycan-binding domain-containing protein [Bacillota bacterium]
MVIHVVVPGDTLYAISRRYGVSIESVAAANGISDPNVLVVGQALAIPLTRVPTAPLVYAVRPGDSLYAIATLFSTSVQAIAAANAIVNVNLIYVGQQLVMPGWTYQPYTVAAGDTLSRLASRFSTSVQLLAAVNRLTDPNLINVGQSLVIPVRSAPVAPKVPVETNGYLFPLSETSIRRVLSGIAHDLTYVSVFSFPVDGRGGVVYTPGAAGPSVRVARSLGIAPLAVISNFDGSNFAPELARDAMSSPTGDATIASIIEFAVSEGFRGINVDFENMYPEDRQLYTSFIEALSRAAHERGLTLSNAMAPKWADWPNLPWVGAFDYAALAPHLDFTMLMTYEWGWSGGPPMAIAPVNLVRRVLEYAVTQIPPGKILMGIPLYGYDWTVPAPQGTFARTVTPSQADALAARHGVNISFDQTAQAPWFQYVDEAGAQHEVWFEDVRSSVAAHALIDAFGLRGASYWNVMYDYPQNWLALEDRYTVRKQS